LAKDRKPGNGTPRGGASRAGGARGGKGGRTRPPTQVVAQQRPWGLIIGALAVLVFAAAAIGYAVVQVNRANADKVESVDEIDGIESYDYPAGQEHVETPVAYSESPPVGGPHAPPPAWADCTGTVYDIDIRHENAVHSLEHGAVWITYNPDEVSDADIETLSALVENESGRMMSPYEGLDAPISIQSWGHQLKVDSADDERIEQFADFLTLNSEFTPEPGASCENPGFIAAPLPAEPAGAAGDLPATPSESAAPSSSAPATTSAP
jgi:Protein of unknown function (DUF3105)